MVNKLTSGFSLTGNGLRDWLIQRFSAVIIMVYFFVLIGFFYLNPQLDLNTLRHFFNDTWMEIFTLLALLSLFVHSWVGVWTVITDYVKPVPLRITIQGCVMLALVIYFFWGVDILWRLA